MHKQLLEKFLCCPVDKSFPLEVTKGAWAGDELHEGALTCTKCKATFPVKDGIPNFIPSKEVQGEEVAAAKERESKARDEDSVVYDSTVSSYHTEIELNALLNGLTVRSHDVVLDLGAGTGRLTVEFARRGAQVLAMDISPQSLRVNRDKCAQIRGAMVHHLAVDACYLPIRSGMASKAGSGMMLEHIPTPDERRRCLEEIHRVLQPGGQLALTVYNYSWSKRRKRPREGFHGKDLYYYNFDRAEMRKLLSDYRIHTLTALLNLPSRVQSRTLDRVIAAVPPVAGLMGELLFAVAERQTSARPR
jgi:ubiquinone/menaquinone biosynthesis C-methylase UbiE/uncharacterized protein YbaR (Trm112 family)